MDNLSDVCVCEHKINYAIESLALINTQLFCALECVQEGTFEHDHLRAAMIILQHASVFLSDD